MVSPQYAAGFFDGEGCVYIAMNSAGWARLRVEVTQVKDEILYQLQRKYGGTVRSAVVKNRENPRSTWSLLAREEAERFLKDIYPFVVVKRDEVWLALEYLAQRDFSVGGFGSKLSDEEKALRTGFMLAMRNCKVSGNKGNRMLNIKIGVQ